MDIDYEAEMDRVARQHQDLIEHEIACRRSLFPEDRDIVVLVVLLHGNAYVSAMDREYAIRSMDCYDAMCRLVQSLRDPPPRALGADCLVHLVVVSPELGTIC